jgi:hypothetical protein
MAGDLFEDGPELGSGALGRAVGEVEDWGPDQQQEGLRPGREERKAHTLLNAVLLRITSGLSVGDALDALVEVVLGRGALLRIPALCISEHSSSASVVMR